MWMDLTPLKRNRDFRYVYTGQFLSFFGTMMTVVALPYQIYHITHSTAAVGLLGVIQLLPLLIAAFIGGALADVLDRRKLLIRAECGMALGCLALIMNAASATPHLWLIYVIAVGLSCLNGLHRPSLDALIPRLVSHEEIQAVSVLSSFKSTVGMIGGSAVAGFFIASLGLVWTFVIDGMTFVISIVALMQVKSIMPPEQQDKPSLKSVWQALQYALTRQELIGTYVVDFFAMVFAMPNALFPALAVIYGGTKTLGWLYAAPAVGALMITTFSGWTQRIKRHGVAVAVAASLWGVFMACVGLSHQLYFILLFLMLAGAADSVSGIFRLTIWNETIPDKLRGRMASLEMISYMSGPLLGSAQVGFLAAFTGTQIAILIGGILCVVAVLFCVLCLPLFWKYHAMALPVEVAR